jgi:hypothetical protein
MKYESYFPLSQPVDSYQHSYLPSTFIMILYQLLRLRNGLFFSGFPTKINYAFHILQIRATSPAHLFLNNLITLMIVSDEYTSGNLSSCNFVHPSVTVVP